jgi:hypothetical protein
MWRTKGKLRERRGKGMEAARKREEGSRGAWYQREKRYPWLDHDVERSQVNLTGSSGRDAIAIGCLPSSHPHGSRLRTLLPPKDTYPSHPTRPGPTLQALTGTIPSDLPRTPVVRLASIQGR